MEVLLGEYAILRTWHPTFSGKKSPKGRGAEVKRNPLLKGTFRLQSTLARFITSDTVSFLLASGLNRRKRPNANARLKIQTQRGSATHPFPRLRSPRPPAHPRRLPPRTSLACCQSALGESPLLPGPAAPPAARTGTSSARRPPPFSAQARQNGRRAPRTRETSGRHGPGWCWRAWPAS